MRCLRAKGRWLPRNRISGGASKREDRRDGDTYRETLGVAGVETWVRYLLPLLTIKKTKERTKDGVVWERRKVCQKGLEFSLLNWARSDAEDMAPSGGGDRRHGVQRLIHQQTPENTPQPTTVIR